MPVIINGSTGITNVNGSASTPAETGTDTDTGIYYGTNTVGLATNGTNALFIDASQNVGIGTSSPAYKLDVSATSFIAASVSTSYSGAGNIRIADASTTSGSAPYIGSVGNNLTFGRIGTAEYMRIDSSGNVGIGTSSPSYRLDVSGAATATPVTNGIIRILTTGSNPPTGYGGGLVFSQVDSGAVNRDYASITGSRVNSSANNQVDMVFSTGDPGGGSIPITERMRLTTAGNLLVGTTSQYGSERLRVYQSGDSDAANISNASSNGTYPLTVSNRGTTNDRRLINFKQGSSETNCGAIYYNGSATVYATSSDYRLKEDIQDLTGALDSVSRLKPRAYKWKDGQIDDTGFIAHELAEVFPKAVQGEKDAVDAEGNPQYQGIDTSFLVATLTAAIQELKALTDAQASTITALTARIESLETK